MQPPKEIDPTIAQDIYHRLENAEREHQVKIIYACESGSRAWGFASPDSDYDVRFLYAHEPDWYLSFDVEKRRDVIEYPIVDDIDISGWDIRKALYLFTRTNGALIEWLNSPIKYSELGDFAQRLRGLTPNALNNIALCYHYSHMARRNAGEYILKDRVKLKKYFYILRPLLAIRYIEKGLGVPPVEFQKLVDAVAPENILESIAMLLDLKRKTPELGKGNAIPDINAFIQFEIDRHGDLLSGQGRPDLINQANIRDQLNTIFRQTVKDAYV